VQNVEELVDEVPIGRVGNEKKKEIKTQEDELER
jgi:hypothetical protein